ncbi:MAG: hypothetical protein HY367_00365 [Candidatus Aenigmarchaeota archaeon]|nr:hypothetical protein [Candidatus Aenigmarchaeota archaeon]
MLSLSCEELGGAGCSYVGRGRTPAEVKDALFTHAAKAHPDKLKKMTAKQKADMVKMMDQLLAKKARKK